MVKKKSTSKIGAKKDVTEIPAPATETKGADTEILGDEIVEPEEILGSEVVEDDIPEAEIPPPPLDTIHEPAQAAAQIEADKLFEKGVAEAEMAFRPFIEPSADDIQAEVLGRIETARHEHTEALAAFVEDNPGIELDRSADHAKIAARTR